MAFGEVTSKGVDLDIAADITWDSSGFLSNGQLSRAGNNGAMLTYNAVLPEAGDWNAEAAISLGTGQANVNYIGRELETTTQVAPKREDEVAAEAAEDGSPWPPIATSETQEEEVTA